MTVKQKISVSDDEMTKLSYRFSITKTDPIGQMSITVDKVPTGGIDIILSPRGIYLDADETRRLIAWLCGYESS